MAFLVALGLALFVLPSPWSWVAVGLGAAVELGEAWFWWWLSHRCKPSVGAEAMLGAKAVVAVPCHPYGQVRLRGETWQARCDRGAEVGDVVEIDAVEGLTLVVSRQ